MRSSFLPREDTSTVEQQASRGDGRHCSLCWTGICRTQPQVDQLATPEGFAGHRALPHRRAGRASRPLHRLRTYDQNLLQLVPKQELPTVPRQRAPTLAPGARWRDSAHGNKKRLMTLPVEEFLRRFLLHLLPPAFVRIRNFGFLANRNRATLLLLCLRLIGGSQQNTATPASPSTGQTHSLWSCPLCGGAMHVVERLSAAQLLLRAPP